ncbi:hypothetical protein EYF80_060334 [Liparis tanakae]|uniref:Uncharacterized protein n=1 Tax=Liparis tanakae TaxID=230148 RepID=A0A4Z2EKU6_9TELE|nr:hypothetical protein EYF80_060334 [Liparis tanakae]
MADKNPIGRSVKGSNGGDVGAVRPVVERREEEEGGAKDAGKGAGERSAWSGTMFSTLRLLPASSRTMITLQDAESGVSKRRHCGIKCGERGKRTHVTSAHRGPVLAAARIQSGCSV